MQRADIPDYRPLSPWVNEPLFVTHGQCDARSTVTFPVAEHHRRLTGTNLNCMATVAHACEQLD